MKTLLLALVFTAASVAHAGVTGDKIHFQSESTWVSAVYNKSLCLNGDTYEALITKCIDRSNGDSGGCERMIKIRAYQPMVSTRLRCDVFSGREESNCRRWVRVPYVQKRTRTVQFLTDRDRVIRTEKITIPSCN